MSTLQDIEETAETAERLGMLDKFVAGLEQGMADKTEAWCAKARAAVERGRLAAKRAVN